MTEELRFGPDGTPRRPPASHLNATGRPKVRYASRREARHAAEGVTRRTGTSSHEYRCGSCGGWHLATGERWPRL